ncbi:hypothetical protein Tel_02725 [Candidatus Tenderia electrophaga]|jgi:hypothetical protein|uniref:ESPR domain-containing protein n=1 Tax=Candidatus Tenderia electrophaga TaxID=1748243 RepID=A0A0S2TAM0_9GAMM|nr:hypothetical protein Tel_02725 [Candidatus Tenderia electrophaga]
MNKAYKAASSMGAAALVLSGAAMAAAPADGFDQWTASSGAIASDCPAGFTCSGEVTGDGFFQRQISDGTNDYFQTIITDAGVSGTAGNMSFSDESFVRTGNVGGLADKSSITDSTTTGALVETFDTATTLLTGWASTNGTDDEVMIYQGISAVDDGATAGGEDFRTDFWLDQTGTLGSVGKIMRITSGVDIQEQTTSTAAQVQDFVLVDRSGSEVGVGGVDIDGDASDDLTWLAGENVKAIWIGQDMSLIEGVGQEFGFTSYTNVTTSNAVSDFSLVDSTAIDWDTTAPPAGWGSLATDGTGGPF